MTDLPGRPTRLNGITYKQDVACGRLYVVINGKPKKPYEIFVYGTGIKCSAIMEAFARTMSYTLREGYDVEELMRQIETVRCFNAPMGDSCTRALANSLKEFMQDSQKKVDKQ